MDLLGVWLTRFIEGISAWLALTPAGWWLVLRDWVPGWRFASFVVPGEPSVSAGFPMSPPGSEFPPYPVQSPRPLGEAGGGFLPFP